MSPSGSKLASSIPSGIESLERQASISSKMKSPPSKGLNEGEEEAMIGSKEWDCTVDYPKNPVLLEHTSSQATL
ncbi:hypothetical protein Tco_0868584 [Tanacetum coccineum]